MVEPKLDHQQVVRLARDFPIEFNLICDEILRLTGLGRLHEKK